MNFNHSLRPGADHYVRLSGPQCLQLQLRHLCTIEGCLQLDQEACLGEDVRSGVTEWYGTVGDVAVSLAWDWIQMSDGHVSYFAAVAPRTNLKIIDDKGYDLFGTEEVLALRKLIEILPWHGAVAATGACRHRRGAH